MSLAAYVRESPVGAATDVVILDSTIDYTTLEELRAVDGALRARHRRSALPPSAHRSVPCHHPDGQGVGVPALTIGGGPYPSAAPIQTLERDPSLDLVVVGEGEATLVDLLEAFRAGGDLTAVPASTTAERGEVRASTPRAVIAELDTIPTRTGDRSICGATRPARPGTDQATVGPR